MKTLNSLKWAGVVAGVLVIAFSAARSARTGGPDRTHSGHATPPQFVGASLLDSVLVRACGDCHSNTMSSRWFTRVPPVSWVMARGAAKGRTAVNFAEWSRYSPEQRRAFLLASCSDAKRGTMPMPAYVRFRPEAKLSTGDVETICGASR